MIDLADPLTSLSRVEDLKKTVGSQPAINPLSSAQIVSFPD